MFGIHCTKLFSYCSSPSESIPQESGGNDNGFSYQGMRLKIAFPMNVGGPSAVDVRSLSTRAGLGDSFVCVVVCGTPHGMPVGLPPRGHPGGAYS